MKKKNRRYVSRTVPVVFFSLLFVIVSAGCSPDVEKPMSDPAVTDKKVMVEVDRINIGKSFMETEISRWQKYSFCEMSGFQSSALLMASDYVVLYPEGPVNVEIFKDDVFGIYEEYMYPFFGGKTFEDFVIDSRDGNYVQDNKTVKTLHVLVGNYYSRTDAQVDVKWNFPNMPSNYPFENVIFGACHHGFGCTFDGTRPASVIFYDMCKKFVEDMVAWSYGHSFSGEPDPTTTIISFSLIGFTSVALSHEFAHSFGLSDAWPLPGDDCHDDDRCICVMNGPIMNRIRYASSLNDANDYIYDLCDLRLCSTCGTSRGCTYEQLVPTQ
ncbi:MAG: hypothetical protein JSV33_01005 [bacterium]|nr:MAG: hypothetical protein JSV33_01005 [bacterium]